MQEHLQDLHVVCCFIPSLVVSQHTATEEWISVSHQPLAH